MKHKKRSSIQQFAPFDTSLDHHIIIMFFVSSSHLFRFTKVDLAHEHATDFSMHLNAFLASQCLHLHPSNVAAASVSLILDAPTIGGNSWSHLLNMILNFKMVGFSSFVFGRSLQNSFIVGMLVPDPEGLHLTCTCHIKVKITTTLQSKPACEHPLLQHAASQQRA